MQQGDLQEVTAGDCSDLYTLILDYDVGWQY